jgi:hypothetical protein
MKPLDKAERAELALLMGLFVVYAAAFSVFNSAVVHGARVLPLFDDAMISMRFAKNLALGQGLRFNGGEPAVEGFSNPAWTLLMAAVIKVVGSGLPPMAWMRGLALATQLLGLGLAWGFCRDAFPERPQLRFLVALFYGISLPALYWVEMGMETGLQGALLIGAVWAAWRVSLSGRAGWTLPLLCLGGPFLRLDMAMTLAVVAAAAAWRLPAARRVLALRCVLLMALGLALQTGLRWWYYADLLPNTYYLKMTGLPLSIRLARGFLTLGDLLRQGWGLILVLGLAGCLFGAGQRAWLLAAPVLAAVGVHVWVGGDAWEGSALSRFLVQALFFAYFSCGLGIVVLVEKLRARHWRWSAALAGSALVLASVAIAERDHEGGWQVAGLRRHAFYVDSNLYMAQMGVIFNRITPPGARWAFMTIGNFGYFSDAPVLDLLGKCDHTVARLPARSLRKDADPRGYVPGHTKVDYAWSLGHEQPDLVQGYLVHPEEAQAILAQGYDRVQLRDPNLLAFYCRKDRLQDLLVVSDALLVEKP